jgi:hypothetical protein
MAAKLAGRSRREPLQRPLGAEHRADPRVLEFVVPSGLDEVQVREHLLARYGVRCDERPVD